MEEGQQGQEEDAGLAVWVVEEVPEEAWAPEEDLEEELASEEEWEPVEDRSVLSVQVVVLLEEVMKRLWLLVIVFALNVGQQYLTDGVFRVTRKFALIVEQQW